MVVASFVNLLGEDGSHFQLNYVALASIIIAGEAPKLITDVVMD